MSGHAVGPRAFRAGEIPVPGVRRPSGDWMYVVVHLSRTGVLVVLVAVLGVIAAGCSGSGSTASIVPSASSAATPVVSLAAPTAIAPAPGSPLGALAMMPTQPPSG